MPGATFLDLPRELRDVIYNHCLPKDDVLRIQHPFFNGKFDCIRSVRKLYAISLLNRHLHSPQIQKEAYEFLGSSNRPALVNFEILSEIQPLQEISFGLMFLGSHFLATSYSTRAAIKELMVTRFRCDPQEAIQAAVEHDYSGFRNLQKLVIEVKFG